MGKGVGDLVKEILDLYIKLGKTVHRDYLNGNEIADSYSIISKEIIGAEKEEFLKNFNEEDQVRLCPECSTEYEESYNFCTNCGFNLKEYKEARQDCKYCGITLDDGDMFCKACGGLNSVGDLGEA